MRGWPTLMVVDPLRRVIAKEESELLFPVFGDAVGAMRRCRQLRAVCTFPHNRATPRSAC